MSLRAEVDDVGGIERLVDPIGEMKMINTRSNSL